MKSIHKLLFLGWKSFSNGIIIIALLFIFTIIGCDKDKDQNLVNETELYLALIDGVFTEVELDEAPVYINGGRTGFVKAIFEAITYPAEARENDIQGICIVHYEITEHGTVENIIAIQDPGGGIGQSAVNTIESVTTGVSFTPGILNGVSVRVRKELEIKFVLQ